MYLRLLQIGLLSLALCCSQSSSLVAQALRLDTAQTRTFGDSLTHNDYLFLLFGTNPLIYGQDPAEAFFNKASQPGDQLQNFAVLGSSSVDVLAQVTYYAQQRQMGLLPPATLLSLQAGGNDFLDIPNFSANLFLLASAPAGKNELADAVTEQLHHNLGECLRQLAKADDAPIVVWTVPDVTLSPYVLSFGFNPTQTANIRSHVARINQRLRALGQRRGYLVLDVEQILTRLTLSPPQIAGVTILPTPYFGAGTFQFADPIHPTGVVNALVANEMIRLANEEFGTEIPTYSETELAIIAGILN